MSLALLFHYLMLNMFRMLVQPSSGTCVLFVALITGCIALVRCVLVLRCVSAGVVWCGIRMQAEVFSFFKDRRTRVCLYSIRETKTITLIPFLSLP